MHGPEVLCIAKGKASAVMLRDSGVIASAVSFKDNIYDGNTLNSALDQSLTMTVKVFRSVLVDKGYRGQKNVKRTDIIIPRKPNKKLSAYHRKKQRKRNGRRAAIEAVIGHLKSDYRMARCFLKGAEGAGLKLVLAAAAWNLKKWMREVLFALIFELKRRNYTSTMYYQTNFTTPLKAV